MQVNKTVCKEQFHAVDEQLFDVVEKSFFKGLSSDHKFKNFERDWQEALYSFVSQSKIAHNSQSKDGLLMTSHQHKGAKKVSNEIGVLDSDSWLSFARFRDINEGGDSSICTERNHSTGVAKKLDLEGLSTVSLRYDCATDNIFTPTNNHSKLCLTEWVIYLGDSLAKNTTLTSLSLTIKCFKPYMREDWTKGLGDGLAKNTSLTNLSLTINSSDLYMREAWTKCLVHGLARNTSLTALSLTFNSIVLQMGGDWARQLGDCMAKRKLVTTVTLRFNYERLVSEDCLKGLGEALAKSASLATVTLIVNGDSYGGGELAKGLGHSLAKSSVSSLVPSCNDSQLLKIRNWRIAANMAECTLVPFPDLLFEFDVHETDEKQKKEKTLSYLEEHFQANAL